MADRDPNYLRDIDGYYSPNEHEEQRHLAADHIDALEATPGREEARKAYKVIGEQARRIVTLEAKLAEAETLVERAGE